MGYRNQLVLDGRLNDVGAYMKTNVGDRAGLELEAWLQIGRSFALNGNAALVATRCKTSSNTAITGTKGARSGIEYRNTNLAFSPDATARLRTSWAVLQQTRHDLSVSLSGKYVGKQFLDNTSNENTNSAQILFFDLRLN